MQEQLVSNMKMSRYDSGKSNGVSEKKDPKQRSSNFEAVVNDKTSTNHSPLPDGIHRTSQCEAFKRKSPDDRSEIAKEDKLCFPCLSGSHQFKGCKTRKCDVDGCQKVHNRLLHESVKAVESADSNDKTNVATISNNIVRGPNQLVPIRIHGNYGS